MGSRRFASRPAGDGLRRCTRRVLSVCFLVLLTGAAAAPHRHKNDLADLLTEAPSDSGVFLDVAPIGGCDATPLAESVHWIDDDPCPACLPSDFVAAPPAVPPRKTDLLVSHRRPVVAAEAEYSLPRPLPGSRSPPSL
jgi:hypothetical protein